MRASLCSLIGLLHGGSSADVFKRGERRKLSSMAGLLVSPNCTGPLATLNKEAALCLLYCALEESFPEHEGTRGVRKWGNLS